MALTQKQVTGTFGEKLAANYLNEKGVEIIRKNYRYRKGEIDLIGIDKDTLVFFEVKTRDSDRFGHPEIFINRRQKSLIRQTANHFCQLISWDGPWRVDVIAITGAENPSIEHLIDSF